MDRHWAIDSGDILCMAMWCSRFNLHLLKKIAIFHAGNNFMIAKALEDNSLNGFTLSVKDLTEPSTNAVDADGFYDAHYIAIGK